MKLLESLRAEQDKSKSLEKRLASISNPHIRERGFSFFGDTNFKDVKNLMLLEDHINQAIKSEKILFDWTMYLIKNYKFRVKNLMTTGEYIVGMEYDRELSNKMQLCLVARSCNCKGKQFNKVSSCKHMIIVESLINGRRKTGNFIKALIAIGEYNIGAMRISPVKMYSIMKMKRNLTIQVDETEDPEIKTILKGEEK